MIKRQHQKVFFLKYEEDKVLLYMLCIISKKKNGEIVY